jgi:16S rRNA processing protein RimM
MPRKRRADEGSGARAPGETLAVGRIVRPHGVRGGMLLEAYSELATALHAGTRVYLGDAKRAATVAGLRRHGDRYLLELKDCESREEAEAWRSAEVRVGIDQVEALPPGTYFHWQILGLTVLTDQGQVLGQVTEILTTGANDVYVVNGDREILLPATAEVIQQVDPAAGKMTVHLLPGIVDETEPK